MLNKTSIILARHGRLNNPQGIIYDGSISLSGEGKEEMHRLGRVLHDMEIVPDAIVSSDFRRAVQSSVEMMRSFAYLNLTIETDPRLQDPHSPDMFGKSLAWLEQIVDPYTHPDLQSWRIERPHSFTARMVVAINDAVSKYKGKTVFIVSHGDPTAFAMWQLLNPGQSLPSLREIRAEKYRVPYLEKGQAWQIWFDDQGNVFDHEHIANPSE